MRIIFVTRGLHDAGGTERMTSFVASSLALRGFGITIVALQQKGEPFFHIDPAVRIEYLRSHGRKRQIAELRKLYAACKPHLIVAVGTNRSFINVPAAKGYPLASWEHFNTTVLSHPLHGLSRRSAARNGWIITLTEEDAEAYRRKFRAPRVVTLPNPVTIEGVKKSDALHKCVLAVGRLKSQKGFDRLIRAWELVHRVYPEWKLRIVGSGSREQSLKRLISKLHLCDAIEMIPHTTSVSHYYSQADIFALSSRYEGFGLVVVEAFSAGLPVVAFDVPCGPYELIAPAEAGLVVSDGDITAFAQALITLIQDPALRLHMGENALSRAHDFRPEKIISLWEDFLATF